MDIWTYGHMDIWTRPLPPLDHFAMFCHNSADGSSGPEMDSVVSGLAATSAASISPSFLGTNTMGKKTPEDDEAYISTKLELTTLLTITTATAPASFALCALVEKAHVPRLMSTIFPRTAAAFVNAPHPSSGSAYTADVARAQGSFEKKQKQTTTNNNNNNNNNNYIDTFSKAVVLVLFKRARRRG